MDKFKNKYRIASVRLQNYDYGQDGAYFVTICTKDRQRFFGEIIDDEMKYSQIGIIACDCWQSIPEHFPFVKLGEWVIMPNHVHGIIIIDNDTTVETPNLGVSTNNHKKQWQPGTLGAIINQYKRICTINIRKINPQFAWQPRFYDHIIRNETSYQNISQYIVNNPLNWQKDELYQKG